MASRRFLETGDVPSGAWEEIGAALRVSTSEFAAAGVSRPQLWSVRSSPGASMPGVLNSALYLGLTGATLDALISWGGARFGASVRLGYLKTLGRLRGLSRSRYRGIVAEIAGPTKQASWSPQMLSGVCDAYEALIVDESQRPLPVDLFAQVREGIEGVFASWDGVEARRYRRRHHIPDESGMALVAHPMTFGEVGGDSGAGTAFSRDPSNGAPGMTGAYLPGVSRPGNQPHYPGLDSFATTDPVGFEVVASAVARLESERGDLVRVDFVKEQGQIWLIEARSAERTAEASVRVAVDLVDEGLLTRNEALRRVDPESLAGMLHPRLEETPTDSPLAAGTAASPGAASGPLVLTANAAITAAESGTPAILALREVLPRDLDGVVTAAGLLTSHGGGTSHAALAARAAGTPSVTGVADLFVDSEAVHFGSRSVKAGEWLTLDGATGQIYPGRSVIAQPPGANYLDRLLAWADEVRELGVWANADTARAAAIARDAGADGIGLARTEYMFHGERLAVVRRILLSVDERDRDEALEELESLQIEDFVELLEAMDGTPVVVRLLDPPVHEFLPSHLDVEHEIAARRAAEEP
ncbi:MAG: pyruvate, phosphate dikinase, partial [Acidimicrobiia bacterium]|nr:pyruvate, phosphate dikinase [Acidimicrobiia bacterium]